MRSFDELESFWKKLRLVSEADRGIQEILKQYCDIQDVSISAQVLRGCEQAEFIEPVSPVLFCDCGRRWWVCIDGHQVGMTRKPPDVCMLDSRGLFGQ